MKTNSKKSLAGKQNPPGGVVGGHTPHRNIDISPKSNAQNKKSFSTNAQNKKYPNDDKIIYSGGESRGDIRRMINEMRG